MANGANNVNVAGHTGVLSIKDGVGYKPIVCLTSTSYNAVSNVVEKVNYCTQGQTKSKVTSISESVSFEAEIVTLGTGEAGATYADLLTAQKTMEEQEFKLDGRNSSQTFKAVISDLSDSFVAGEDATFSGTLTINPEEEEVTP